MIENKLTEEVKTNPNSDYLFPLDTFNDKNIERSSSIPSEPSISINFLIIYLDSKLIVLQNCLFTPSKKRKQDYLLQLKIPRTYLKNSKYFPDFTYS